MKIQSILTVVALSVVPFVSQAQEDGGVATEESFIPRFSVASAYFSWSDDADFSDQSGSVSIYEYGANAAFPLIKNDRFKLTGGVRYRANEFDFASALEPFGSRSLDLHRIELPLNLWTTHSEKWKSWIRLSPGISSDFEDVSDEDITVSALALLSYKYSEQLSFAFGGYVSRDLGEYTVLPALGFIWKPNQHWVVGLTAPRVEIMYAPTRDWLFTVRAYPSGGGWNVSGLGDADEDVDFNYSAVRAALGIDRRLTGRLWGFVDVGYQFAQEIEIDGGDYDFSEDIDANLFINTGVKLRF